MRPWGSMRLPRASATTLSSREPRGVAAREERDVARRDRSLEQRGHGGVVPAFLERGRAIEHHRDLDEAGEHVARQREAPRSAETEARLLFAGAELAVRGRREAAQRERALGERAQA